MYYQNLALNCIQSLICHKNVPTNRNENSESFRIRQPNIKLSVY